jgi:hydroxyacylglutathione hydrolase
MKRIAIIIMLAFAVLSNCKKGSKDYVSTRIKPGVWHIEDTVDKTVHDSMYLVEGGKTAALIDTGMGKGDLAGYVKSLTKLPVIVLISHGHRDHTGQASQFPVIYFPMDDAFFKPPFELTAAKELSDGQKIDLGGRILEVIAVPGHTPGSVVFLDGQTRMLFSGDAIGSSYVWMHIKGALPLQSYLNSVRKLESRKSDFDFIYGGHFYQSAYKPLTSSYVTDMRIVIEKVLNGEIAGIPYNIGDPGGLSATYASATVIYNPKLLYGEARSDH